MPDRGQPCIRALFGCDQKSVQPNFSVWPGTLWRICTVKSRLHFPYSTRNERQSLGSCPVTGISAAEIVFFFRRFFYRFSLFREVPLLWVKVSFHLQQRLYWGTFTGAEKSIWLFLSGRSTGSGSGKRYCISYTDLLSVPGTLTERLPRRISAVLPWPEDHRIGTRWNAYRTWLSFLCGSVFQ